MPCLTPDSARPYVYRMLIFICFVFLASTSINSQTTDPTDATTPLALSPGSPAGSYALSDFENVNPYNGNLNFHLPLISLAGRGVATSSILRIDSKSWRVKHVATTDANGFPVDVYTPVANPWTPGAGYGAGKMIGRRSGLYPDQTCGATRYIYQQTLTRLTFIAADGTEYEFRDDLTRGQPAPVTNPCATTGAPRGTVFVTADGNAATFISDDPIYDRLSSMGGGGVPYVSGYLMLRDGVRYRIDNGSVSWIRDRNGNKLFFGYTDGRVTSITDSLNRQVTYTYADFGNTFYDQITFKGFGGQNRTIRVNYARLQYSLRTTNPRNEPASRYQIQTYQGLFPELNNASSSTQWNPYVVSSVTLPNNKQYQLFYNCFAELARVTLPTGGAIEYDYTAGSGALMGGDGYQIYRRVKERRVLHDGSNIEGYTAYAETVNPATVDHRNASGTLLSRQKHYYHGNPLDSLFNAGGVLYPGYREGREFKTESYAADGVTVVRRSETTWANRAPVSWWNPVNGDEPPNDLRETDTTTTLTDVTPNLVSRQTFAYDDSVPFNNRSDVYEYDFGTGAAGPLIRRSHTEYLKTNAVNSTDYTATSIHMRSLPTQIQIFDAAGVEKARTTFEYDNYTTPLEPRANISGLDAGFTTGYVTRGNLTRTTQWILSTSTPLHSYLQYDVAGNVVKTVDARGNATTFEFNDRYGSPDTEAQGNTAPSELGGQTSFAFATKVTNVAGHISFAQFDYYLGKPVNGQDPNGIVASGFYNDSLDRPTHIKRAIGTAVENQTTFAYDDVARIVTSSSDLNSNNDNLLVSKVVYDGLGRSKETRQYESGTDYIKTEQQYDALGRVYKVSNPYRLSENAEWSTTAFDALGRVTSVSTPDSAVVGTVYSGNAVTVTDQAGKARKSITDGLGRLIKVIEDPSGLNYETTYSYDVLDNLVKVTQGSQQRYFMYDSLKRLIRARNPEQNTRPSLNLSDPVTGNSTWSTGYEYDSNSNLTFKTDPRGIVTENRYDVLNRVTTILYRINGQPDPNTGDVEYLYDNATNGKGRLWLTYKWGSKPSHTAVGLYDALGRVTQFYSLFGDGQGGWSPGYAINRTYNLAGNVTSQTYPSGHTVNYTYDAAGRTSSFSGNLGGDSRTYATGVTYSSWGSVSREQFGTDTALYQKSFYNKRGQLFDTRLSSVNDTWDWNRGRFILYYSTNHVWGESGTDNNGNVRFAETWIPPANAALDQVDTLIEDSYSYDSLNRLSSVAEQKTSVAGGWGTWTQQFRQQYGYDRWGNRTIDAGQTWGIGINNKQFAVDSATNRLGVPSGQSGVMTYDDAGNLITDTYSGAGAREYDAENKMTRAWGGNNQWQEYTYNANGQRTRRKVDGQETWQIYGIDGELLAEYAANGAAIAPQKEYGYRNGQLLVTAEPGNVALASNGATVTGSSTLLPYAAGNVIDGSRRAINNTVWADGTFNNFPDWLEVNFNSSRTISEIDVITQQDDPQNPLEPTLSQTFSLYGITAFDVQYWNGSAWVTVPGGSVTGNNKVWRQFNFSPVTTNKIRLVVNGGADNSFSRVVEVEAWSLGSQTSSSNIHWLVTDQLGTPRIIVDQTGSLANVKRHDYLPFGEELPAGTGGRTTALGYVSGDGVRQQFTQKERDVETGLDYFGARYYGSIHGRFISPDSYSGNAKKPQTFNLYSYVMNNPLAYIDPTGHSAEKPCDESCQQKKKEVAEARKKAKEDGIDTVQINTNQNKNKPVIEFGEIFRAEMAELAQREEHGGDFVRGGEARLRSMFSHQMSPILYLNPMPRYIQGEVDLPSPTGTTGWALQLTLDDEGAVYFGHGPYVGTPGGSLSAGWLSPRTAPDDYISGWGAGITVTGSKSFGTGLGYASGHFSPQVCVGTPGLTGSVTNTHNLGNSRLRWRPKL
jgi:RHS repeat-associated protein